MYAVHAIIDISSVVDARISDVVDDLGCKGVIVGINQLAGFDGKKYYQQGKHYAQYGYDYVLLLYKLFILCDEDIFGSVVADYRTSFHPEVFA